MSEEKTPKMTKTSCPKFTPSGEKMGSCGKDCSCDKTGNSCCCDTNDKCEKAGSCCGAESSQQSTVTLIDLEQLKGQDLRIVPSSSGCSGNSCSL